MRIPKPEHVERQYDFMVDLYNIVNKGDIHFGFFYDENDDTPIEEAQKRFTDILIERLSVKGGDHVLDIGCGMGGAALRLAEKTGCSVTGIALSASEIEHANNNAEQLGLTESVEFYKRNFLTEIFKQTSFDAVLAIESLTHMDREAALSRIYEFLKPGGKLVFADGFEKKTLTRKQRNICFGTFQISLLPFEMYDSLFKKAGFEKIEMLDITKNLQSSFHKMIDDMNKKSKKIEEVYGKKTSENIINSYLKLVEVYDECIGYSMGVLRKP